MCFTHCQCENVQKMRKCALTFLYKNDNLVFMKKILTLTELSDYLGIKKRTLYEMMKDGRFPVPSVKGVTPRVWATEDVDTWRDDNE